MIFKKKIREYAPFIILAYSLLFAIASYFEFYYWWYSVVLPDLVGFSIFTNIFMYTVYMNKKYCTSTKLCVAGLIVLNALNIFYGVLETFGHQVNGTLYDIYLLSIIVLVLILKKIA